MKCVSVVTGRGCGVPAGVVEKRAAATRAALSSYVARSYWQPGNLKLPIQVLQLNVPLAFRYSFV
jgi:hypothetical protein